MGVRILSDSQHKDEHNYVTLANIEVLLDELEDRIGDKIDAAVADIMAAIQREKEDAALECSSCGGRPTAHEMGGEPNSGEKCPHCGNGTLENAEMASLDPLDARD